MNVSLLLAEIDELFERVPLHAKSSRYLDNLYEAFVLGLVLQGSRTLGAAVSWHYVSGALAKEVRLRGSPGEIYTKEFTYAEIAFDSTSVFEAHAGIRVRGATVKHECDVVVLHAGIADVRRSSQDTPFWSDTAFAVEAKAYATTRVDLKVARQVLGLAVELRHQRVALVTSRPIDLAARQVANHWLFLGAWESVQPGALAAAELMQRFSEELLP